MRRAQQALRAVRVETHRRVLWYLIGPNVQLESLRGSSQVSRKDIESALSVVEPAVTEARALFEQGMIGRDTPGPAWRGLRTDLERAREEIDAAKAWLASR